jgi:hypothetical protein
MPFRHCRREERGFHDQIHHPPRRVLAILGSDREAEKVRASQWVSMRSVMRGKFRLASITPKLEDIVDGIGFPAITPWTVGAWAEGPGSC